MSVISKLIDDGYKAVIVECGHGALLSNEFLSVRGASKMVLMNKQPYSKEVQIREYPGVDGLRSVSKEFVHNVMFKEMDNFEHMCRNEKFLCFTTSFQLGDDTSLCHGYFGIGKMVDHERYFTVYHLTFYTHGLPKDLWIETIKDDLIDIITNHFYATDVTCSHVDGIWESVNLHKLTENIEATLIINQHYKTVKDENFVCFTPDNKLIRFEDILRLNKGNKRGIILQKGSFNPFHRMHKNIGIDASNAYPDYPHVLMLSGNTCDKGKNDPAALEERILNMTKQGYYVIVSKSGMFIENIQWIRNYYTDLQIIFPVGEDTIERFLRDWEDYYKDHRGFEKMASYRYGFANVEWFITRRTSDTKHFGDLIPTYAEAYNNFKFTELPMDDISSTKIRSGEIKNEL